MFIVSYCILTVFLLLNLGVNIDGRAERAQSAIMVCSKRMSTIRHWASNATNFYSDWSAVVGTFPDPEFSDLQVTLAAANVTLCSPCTQLGALHFPPANPTDDRRKMPNTFKKVVIKASWDPGTPTANVTIASLVGAPSQVVSSLSITPSAANPNPVPQNALLDFSVQALDGSGAVIPDVSLTGINSPLLSVARWAAFPPWPRSVTVAPPNSCTFTPPASACRLPVVPVSSWGRS